EVIVRLHYTGINYAEILSRKGLYDWMVKRPYILGMEGSGVIEGVGEGINRSRIGQKVMVGCQYGCYAEKVVIPEDQAIPTLKHLTMAENAAFLVNYLTAWISLITLANLQSTEKVLITAAAGGVGTAAIQLAANWGCSVYGLAGSSEKIEFINSLGATGGFNYREKGCFDRLRKKTGGVDVILEMVGGKVYKESFKSMNPLGRMTVAGFSSFNLQKWNPLSWLKTLRDLPKVNLLKLGHKSGGIMATHVGYLLKYPDKLMSLYNELRTFASEKQIKPVIGSTFPFDQAAAAHSLIESRQSIGKILLSHDN
ncbi:MAG: zinc-binding dehydrogenase, partial [Phycisphaerae bacterium]|nr:zinc-binding dehydrogenase [Phycisphaerae bacterium]NIV00308.1 zinc-binding dehydrogenase [Phycisphaerae bacterium]NIX30372.1 zinc-binding dehydrogenase [Phycisphaerae bacterium]